MNDRKMKKWQPFDSLTNSAKMKHELALKKQKETMPTLSQDQVERINENLSNAYSNKILVKLTYFSNNKILKRDTFIKKIDLINKNIVINENITIPFKYVINIDLLQ